MPETADFSLGTSFLARCTEGPVAVVMDGDADGLSGGRLVTYTLTHRKVECVAVFPGKGEHAYAPSVFDQVQRADAKAVVVVDSGASAENPYQPLPVLVLDHHQPLGMPEGVTFVSSYRHEPPETSSLIAYLACRPLVDIEPVQWLALLGVFGDLGSADAFEYLTPLVRRYTKSALRKAVTLLNSARRSSHCDVATAYEALCAAKTPRDVASRRTAASRKLETYRKEVHTALNAAAGSAPVFSEGIAMLRIDSPCLVHGLLASRWASRLKRYPVMVVNTGYLPGKAVFSLRTFGDEDLIGLLRGHVGADEHLGGTVGYGHRTATGGQIPVERLPELLAAFGFDGS